MTTAADIDVHPKAWVSRVAMRLTARRRQAFLAELRGRRGEAIDECVLDPAWERRNSNARAHMDMPVDQAAELFFETQRLAINRVLADRALKLAVLAVAGVSLLSVFAVVQFAQNGIVRRILTIVWNLI